MLKRLLDEPSALNKNTASGIKAKVDFVRSTRTPKFQNASIKRCKLYEHLLRVLLGKIHHFSNFKVLLVNNKVWTLNSPQSF